MYGNLLVTPTLLDSFDFASSCPPDWRDRAMAGFVTTIKREHVDYPAFVKKGRDFENRVYRTCNEAIDLEDALDNNGSKLFNKVVKAVYGSSFQDKIKKNVTVDGEKVFLFGYTDAQTEHAIDDIKTCLKWSGRDKYLGKNQHIQYLYMTGKQLFRYIVAEWESEFSNKIKSVNIIEYTNPGVDKLEKILFKRIKDMFTFIRNQGLWDDYYFTFSKN